jgi:hypothetical protein
VFRVSWSSWWIVVMASDDADVLADVRFLMASRTPPAATRRALSGCTRLPNAAPVLTRPAAAVLLGGAGALGAALPFLVFAGLHEAILGAPLVVAAVTAIAANELVERSSGAVAAPRKRVVVAQVILSTLAWLLPAGWIFLQLVLNALAPLAMTGGSASPPRVVLGSQAPMIVTGLLGCCGLAWWAAGTLVRAEQRTA